MHERCEHEYVEISRCERLEYSMYLNILKIKCRCKKCGKKKTKRYIRVPQGDSSCWKEIE